MRSERLSCTQLTLASDVQSSAGPPAALLQSHAGADAFGAIAPAAPVVEGISTEEIDERFCVLPAYAFSPNPRARATSFSTSSTHWLHGRAFAMDGGPQLCVRRCRRESPRRRSRSGSYTRSRASEATLPVRLKSACSLRPCRAIVDSSNRRYEGVAGVRSTAVAMNAQGRLTVPADARKALGLVGEAQFQAEVRDEGLLLRPAVLVPREDAWAYTPSTGVCSPKPVRIQHAIEYVSSARMSSAISAAPRSSDRRLPDALLHGDIPADLHQQRLHCQRAQATSEGTAAARGIAGLEPVARPILDRRNRRHGPRESGRPRYRRGLHASGFHQ